MRADFSGISTDEIFGRAAIIADRPNDIARLSRLLDATSGVQVAYRGDLAEFTARRGETSANLALVHISGDLTPAQWMQIETLTRSLMLVIIGDARGREASARMAAARAWAFADESGLTPGALADIVCGLNRAHQSEDRLLRRIAIEDARVNRLSSAARLIAPILPRVEDSIWDLISLVGASPAASEAGDRAARAFDVVDELHVLNEEFAECVKAAGMVAQSPGAADLNRVVEDFVRANAATSNVSAQTGCDPIFVRPAAAALRHLLETLLSSWRATAHPEDKLELLTWDSGAEARLAVVLTRIASETPAAAPAFIALRNIFRKLDPMVQACGVDVEASFAPTGESDSASMTICLPKRPPANLCAAATRRPAFRAFAPQVRDRAE